MNSISKNEYVDKLDSNAYHSKIKLKPIDVKPSAYIDFNKENNKEDNKFEVGGHIRIAKYKNIFPKG